MITSVLTRALPLEGPYPLTAGRLIEAMGGPTSITGKAVNPTSALGVAALYAAVRDIAEDIAKLPLITYRRLNPQGKERATDHPLYPLLHDDPNPLMTAFTLKETLMGHLLLRGNCFAEIVRDVDGMPTEVWPLRPDNMMDVQVAPAGSLVYLYSLPKGEGMATIPQRNMLHIRGLSPDGIMGYSPITLHRETIGLAMAAEEFGARFFGNSARPGGVLQTKSRLKDDSAARLRDSWNAAHQGLSAAHRVAILEEGVEWKQVGLSPDDAQWMATRNYQNKDIARIFRMPPHKIGDLEHATYTNIEHQSIEYVVDTLGPWLSRWEGQIHKDLVPVGQRREIFVEFLVDALLRGDAVARASAHATLRQNGVISANEWRADENENPIEGGDVYWRPVNMVDASLPMQPATMPQTSGGAN